MAKQVVCTIDPSTGGVTIEAQGYKGPECRSATSPYEKLFGEPASDTPTKEMNVKTAAQIKQGLGG